MAHVARGPTLNKSTTPPPLMATLIEQARQLRATDRELARQRSIATRNYAYGDGTSASLMAIHNKQTENWLKLLNLYGMTKEQWLKTSEPERRRIWGD